MGAPTPAASALFGPSPYLSAADVPAPAGFYQRNAPALLDNFEAGSGIDGGLSGSAGARIGPGAFTGARDSVDSDDGLIDGSGVTGSSWCSGAGTTGVRFAYSGNDLPTAFGLVWTNGAGTITFSALDGNRKRLVSQAICGIPDGSFGGTTAEDRFFGVTYDATASSRSSFSTPPAASRSTLFGSGRCSTGCPRPAPGR